MSNFIGQKTTIRTRDFKKAKDFYTNILQCTIIENYDDGDGIRGCIMQVGDSTSSAFIELSEITAKHSYFQEPFKKVFANDKIDLQIQTTSIVYWAERLNQLWKVKGPIDRPWGSKYLYLRDPDGLQIIIYQEFKNYDNKHH